MANTPNPNIINESDFFASLDAGEIQEVNKPPLVAGAPEAPPSLPPQTIPTLQGSLPLGMQLPTDLIRTQTPGVPSVRLFPVAPAGTAGTNSAVTSGTRGISNTANQANKTATSANTTAKSASAAVTVVSSTPVLQTTGVGGAIQSKPIVGGSPIAVTQDNLTDGSGFVRLASTHAVNNVSYNFGGAWFSATSYVVGDEVFLNGSYWICLIANTNSQPSLTNSNWQTVGLNTLDSFDATGQTASIAPTTLVTAPVSGFYFLSAAYLVRHTGAGSAIISATFSWVQSTISLNSTGPTATSGTLTAAADAFLQTIFADAGSVIQLSTTLSGTPVGGYDIHARVLGPF